MFCPIQTVAIQDTVSSTLGKISRSYWLPLNEKEIAVVTIVGCVFAEYENPISGYLSRDFFKPSKINEPERLFELLQIN